MKGEHPITRAIRERRDQMRRDGLPCLLCDRKGNDYPCAICQEACRKCAASWPNAFPALRKKVVQ